MLGGNLLIFVLEQPGRVLMNVRIMCLEQSLIYLLSSRYRLSPVKMCLQYVAKCVHSVLILVSNVLALCLLCVGSMFLSLLLLSHVIF